MIKLILLALVLSVLVSAGIVWAAREGNTLHTVAGEMVAGIPLKNGDVVVVTLFEEGGTQTVGFTYLAVEGPDLVTQVSLGESERPESITVKGCGAHVHVFASWGQNFVKHLAWRVPVELDQVFLPVMCQ